MQWTSWVNRIVVFLSHKHSGESAAQYCVASQEHCKQPDLPVANHAAVNEHASKSFLDTAPQQVGTAAFCIATHNVQAALMGSIWQESPRVSLQPKRLNQAHMALFTSASPA